MNILWMTEFLFPRAWWLTRFDLKTLHADKVRSNAEICGISWIGRYFLEEIDRLATINKLSLHGILRIDSQMFVKRAREERETCLFN